MDQHTILQFSQETPPSWNQWGCHIRRMDRRPPAPIGIEWKVKYGPQTHKRF